MGRQVPPIVRRGMVASTQAFASREGLEVLREGGTAADACVAMDAVLHVTEPPSTSLGGDLFALVYDGGIGKITALNGSGRAPRAVDATTLRARGLSKIPERHGHAVTTPGVCAGWYDLIERHGRMPMPRLLAPAITLAEQGFPVGPVTAAIWARKQERLQSAELTIEGRAPRAGEQFRNAGLAKTLRVISESGKEAFYRGEIATAIAQAVQIAGGALTVEDLAAHESTWEEPISTTYRGVQVWQCPPNGQGLTSLIALNILEGLEPRPNNAAVRWHSQIEALRIAFADAQWYVADPAVSDVPIEALLSKDYAARRRSLIRQDRAAVDVVQGSPAIGSGTVYLCAVDGEGNACSFTSSNYQAFGTGIVPEGCGFTLQNRGEGFSLEDGHPNVLAPGKRPYHTIMPGMLTMADGRLWGPFGVMGGFMQPQGQVQLVMALVDDGDHPQRAIDRPRFSLDPVGGAGRVHLEVGVPPMVIEGLRQLGHSVVAEVPSFGRALFGRGQIILRDAVGDLIAGSDTRADGCAAGY